ncbi:MAG TPA: carbonic anhydrase [Tepidisphaeraceae bacterium]|nr:carbonic anhydrase [Tepidisphaeraceae bacterium]
MNRPPPIPGHKPPHRSHARPTPAAPIPVVPVPTPATPASRVPTPSAPKPAPPPPAQVTPSVQVLPPSDVKWTEIELPPDLPMPVFTSSEPWNDKRIGAMAVYCSDGRLGDAFDEFCHRGLSVPRYDRFAVPGGPAWFAHDDEEHPALYRAAKEQMDFLVRVHGLDRILLFTHWGCAFYKHKTGKTPRESWDVQLTDMRDAADTLREWFPKVKVEGYLAMRLLSQITFHRLDLRLK